MNLELFYLVQLHIFGKWVHTFHYKMPPEILLEVKNSENLDSYGSFSKETLEEGNNSF